MCDSTYDKYIISKCCNEIKERSWMTNIWNQTARVMTMSHRKAMGNILLIQTKKKNLGGWQWKHSFRGTNPPTKKKKKKKQRHSWLNNQVHRHYTTRGKPCNPSCCCSLGTYIHIIHPASKWLSPCHFGPFAMASTIMALFMKLLPRKLPRGEQRHTHTHTAKPALSWLEWVRRLQHTHGAKTRLQHWNFNCSFTQHRYQTNLPALLRV